MRKEITYSYVLPKSGTNGANGKIEKSSTKANSLIIIGANGSGKSRLGAWMEQQHPINFHRIGAQRSLVLQERIPLHDYQTAQDAILYGPGMVRHEESQRERFKKDKYFLYEDKKWTTSERQDFDYALSAIFAKRTKELELQDKEAKKAQGQMLQRKNNIVDEVQKLWDTVFTHRKIDFKDGAVYGIIGTNEYNAAGMSDGERVALYLIAQVLCVPENKTIIIDEPEIHLNRSIINRLWKAIEKARQDCLFIYITHDTQFVANHNNSDKIWCKSYDGTSWKWEKVTDSNLPEQLLLDILGSRKQVIFVEGEKNSFDAKLYEAIYKDYYIIPCGGCKEVIARTKAMKNTPQLHDTKVFGIIDRDFRVDKEIESLQKDGIYAINVAEVENLFITEEIFEIINRHLGHGANKTAIAKAIDFVINTKFKNMLAKQICEAAISECKHTLETLDIKNVKSSNEFSKKINNIDYQSIYDTQKKEFENVLQNKDYGKVLRIFNEKGLSKSVGKCFGHDNNDYCELIIRLANGEKEEDIRKALESYLPSEIPLILE